MLLSLSLIFILGMFLGHIFSKIKLPTLIGFILTGIILGPFVLNVLDPTISLVSSDLRQIALIIILTRAGLNLDINELKKAGRPAILLCFFPALSEILAMTVAAHYMINLSFIDSAILGCITAAVSPAVVVPRMLGLMEEGYGKNKGIPEMIMAGASVDDIFVIVVFTSLITLRKGGDFNVLSLTKIPVSIIAGILIGIAVSLFLILFFKNFKVKNMGKVIILLSVAFFLVSLEKIIESYLPFSGLLSVMTMGMVLKIKMSDVSKEISMTYSNLWYGAEVLLFVLVGAIFNVDYLLKAGVITVLLIVTVLIFRMIGVYISLLGSKLNNKERLFVALSYIPKATVQAAIGGVPLALGFESGGIILTVAVVSILITAPLGALFIDNFHKNFLENEN